MPGWLLNCRAGERNDGPPSERDSQRLEVSRKLLTNTLRLPPGSGPANQRRGRCCASLWHLVLSVSSEYMREHHHLTFVCLADIGQGVDCSWVVGYPEVGRKRGSRRSGQQRHSRTTLPRSGLFIPNPMGASISNVD